MFSYKWRCNGKIRIGRNYQKNAIFTKIRIDSGRMMEEAVRLSLASPNSNCLSPFHPFLYLVIPGPSLSVLARLGPTQSRSLCDTPLKSRETGEGRARADDDYERRRSRRRWRRRNRRRASRPHHNQLFLSFRLCVVGRQESSRSRWMATDSVRWTWTWQRS